MKISRQFKRVLAGVLTAALILPYGVTAQAAYYDDTEGHWAEETIEKWSVEYGVLNGYGDGTFRPDNTITRGAFAGILSRFLKYTEEAPKDTFSDTAGNRWESDILKLNAAGVYLGNNGKAQIGSSITRQQALTMICRALQVPESDEALTYADSGSVASYARGYLATLTKQGCITDVGEDNRFRPADAITRAEVVNLLDQIIVSAEQEYREFSSAVGGSLLITAEEGAYLKDAVIGGDLIIGPGVTGVVKLEDVLLLGEIRNLGSAVVETVATEKPVYAHTRTELTCEGKTVPVQQNVKPGDLKEGDFRWENGRLVCTNPDYNARFGIDVSRYQCYDALGNYVPIDWEAVKADGVDFVMVRIGGRGYGAAGTLFADERYAENVDGAMAAGLETGVYFFSQAITVEEAIEEAELVIELLDGRSITGPVTYDWEMGTSQYRVYGIDPAVATACAKAFCRTIEKAGYDPMIYCSQYVGFFKYDLSVLQEYPIWYPEYKNESAAEETLYPNFYYQMDYWQYSESLTVDGIAAKVDGNLQLSRKPTFEYNGETYFAAEDLEPNGLGPGDFRWENDRLVCQNPNFTTKFGVDVSRNQCYRELVNESGKVIDRVYAPIDWEAAKADGVEFAMVRVGYRGTTEGLLYEDQHYAENIDGAMAAGIDTGAYFFSQATTVEEAIEEADFVIERLKEHPISGPVAYDWEMLDSSYRVYGAPPETVTACAKAFCRRMEEAGYDAMIYFSKYVGYVKLDLSQLREYAFWYPEYRYTDNTEAMLYPSFYYQVSVWQYSDSLTVDGISSKVDGNLWFFPVERAAGADAEISKDSGSEMSASEDASEKD